MKRRAFMVAGGSLVMAGSAWAATKKIEDSSEAADREIRDAIARIEATSGGRLGVALHDAGSGKRFAYRADENFEMMSTFKLLLAAAALKQAQQGKVRLDKRLTIQRGDLSGWSPFTERRAGTQATVKELCRAMTVESDNGAAKLVLSEIGGIAGLTVFLRGIGDNQTLAALQARQLAQVGSVEQLLLAESATTTPSAMLANAERLWLGTALSPADRTLLVNWALACRTGKSRLRAGLPAGWRVGHKTGTGEDGIANDVAVFWPPRRNPVVVASYLSGSKLKDEATNAIHAQVARVLTGLI